MTKKTSTTPKVTKSCKTKEPETWTIITALNKVLLQAEDSELTQEFWDSCESPLAYLKEKLGLSDMQIVVLAILIENGNSVSWKDMAEFLACSRLTLMAYADEIEQLVTKRWAVHKKMREFTGKGDGFELADGVLKAIRQNEAFVPEKIDGLSEQQFVDLLEARIDKNLQSSSAMFEDDETWMLQLVSANPELPLCREILKFKDIHVQSLLLMVVFDYAQWADSSDEGLTFSAITGLYPNDFECDGMRNKLKNGTHVLIRKGFIEHKCTDGTANTEQYQLTRRAKMALLSEYVPSRSKVRNRRPDNRYLKKHASIKAKPLFYNATEQLQIEQLTNLLSQENLPDVQKRLEELGMRKGFACLFYGAPGTGKTETVLQIAQKTGRDIMQVDIAGLRDKFVGESEKNIKEVFSRYRYLCKHSDVMPILFFNEADAIMNKRTENISHSVDKMDNAMQNIILQELEELDGILVATTNLTSNLDKAFERRFLYKVEFHKPDTEVKSLIWSSMMKDISSEDAHQLATLFDFSGGQIENIARKSAINYVLSGKHASLEEIKEYCQSELLANTKEHIRVVGFAK